MTTDLMKLFNFSPVNIYLEETLAIPHTLNDNFTKEGLIFFNILEIKAIVKRGVHSFNSECSSPQFKVLH